ncbi:MAG: hypothetical protein AABZ24_08565 [Nitrospirota bacterium]
MEAKVGISDQLANPIVHEALDQFFQLFHRQRRKLHGARIRVRMDGMQQVRSQDGGGLGLDQRLCALNMGDAKHGECQLPLASLPDTPAF